MPNGPLREPFRRRSTEGKNPPKTRKSSAPQPYMGYISSQWHTRQPQAPQQLAAISWCRSPAYRATERAVLMPWSTEGKNPKKTPRQNRVLCGCKCAVGVGRGIPGSPRQLVNQLQRATACSTTDSRSICSSAAAARRHGPCRPLLLQGENRVLRAHI